MPVGFLKTVLGRAERMLLCPVVQQVMMLNASCVRLGTPLAKV
jgi:hypothetical protein